MTARVHVWLSGRVQGVCFRGFAEDRASALGLTGWIRNLWDRRVEVVAEGDRAGLEAFLDDLRTGPPAARVDAAEVRWEKPSDEFPDFRIVSSGY